MTVAQIGALPWSLWWSQIRAILRLELGRTLLNDIRLPERVALRRVRRKGIDFMTLELLYVARLFSRRPSRMGWKSVLRRVWPHAGIVEDTTSADLAWWRRRVVATANNLGVAKKFGIRNSEFGIPTQPPDGN